jgi:hypothetical protein
MGLLERYLHAVRGYLPAATQDDIVAELGDDLRARFEERAAALGRPLTEDEEAELLRPYGRPMLLAARYRPNQHLIGPGWFPYYWTTLKIALAVGLAVHVAIVVALAASGRPLGRAAEALWRFPAGAAVAIFGWVTLVFAALEIAVGRGKILDRWDPRRLPPVTARTPRPSRLKLGFELVIGAAFVVWWTALPRTPWLITGPGEPIVTLAPLWLPFYLPVLIVAIASMTAKAVTLVRPDWATFRFVSGLVMSAASLVLVTVMLRAGDLVAAAVPGSEAETLATVVNMALRISFVVVIAITVLQSALDVRAFVRGRATAGIGEPQPGATRPGRC